MIDKLVQFFLFLLLRLRAADEWVLSRSNVASSWFQETLNVTPYRVGLIISFAGVIFSTYHSPILGIWFFWLFPLAFLAWPLQATETPTFQHQLVMVMSRSAREGVMAGLLFVLPWLPALWLGPEETLRASLSGQAGLAVLYTGLLLVGGVIVPPSQYRKVQVLSPVRLSI